MWQVLKASWEFKETRSRILYTLLFLVLFRAGTFLPIPGVNPNAFQVLQEQAGFLGILNFFTGGSTYYTVSVFTLGVLPYINASIIMQLMGVIFPALENMRKEGEEGRKKLQMYIRWLGAGLAVVMSYAAYLYFSYGLAVGGTPLITPSFESAILTTLILASGSMFLVWLGEVFTMKGLGNGVSLIIFSGILARVVPSLVQFFQTTTNVSNAVLSVIIALIFGLVLVFITTAAYLAERKIPVQYASRIRGTKVYGGQSSSIPIRLLQAGVMPIIFASAFINAPTVISGWFPQSSFTRWWNVYFNHMTIWYNLIYFVLVIFFAYFYNTIAYDPDEIAKNIQKQGGFIPGIRPGKPTADYIAGVINKLTLPASIFLGLVAVLPDLFMSLFGLGRLFLFGGTSLLIVIGVALEIFRQLEAYVQLRHYKGFLEL
ncbi:preprotein translocase subunit SecY [Coprothermobacter platensis]|uniref:preprotein translocase subunit SecY n=1 Tax=Coprothermobacter platensis TaxID=108819 RepID=UPI00036FCFE7|nr:preprotein translocase subunit SecY [Coprothermobacter platensis]